jgi:hypothetical protein
MKTAEDDIGHIKDHGSCLIVHLKFQISGAFPRKWG